jgi:hypothetical protein
LGHEGVGYSLTGEDGGIGVVSKDGGWLEDGGGVGELMAEVGVEFLDGSSDTWVILDKVVGASVKRSGFGKDFIVCRGYNFEHCC